MPQYMLAVCHDEPYDDADFDSPDMQRIGAKVGAINEEMERAGAWVFGTGLRPVSTASVVRAGVDGVTTTDGPFAETKEHIGGFWIIEAADLDAARDWAARASAACELPIELRPCEGS
jgi:hypothetical protein